MGLQYRRNLERNDQNRTNLPLELANPLYIIDYIFFFFCNLPLDDKKSSQLELLNERDIE